MAKARSAQLYGGLTGGTKYPVDNMVTQTERTLTFGLDHSMGAGHVSLGTSSGTKEKVMARMILLLLTAVLLNSFAKAAFAEIRLEGYFIAEDRCPAFQSLRKLSNPGDVHTEVGRAYQVLGKNKVPGSHYRIRIEAQPPERWVAMHCGEHVDRITGGGKAEGGPRESAESDSRSTRAVLAVSWQPAFCELHRGKPECEMQTRRRFDADHFTLHGLWPDGTYCGVEESIISKDKSKQWGWLPPLCLSTELRDELAEKMPGVRSSLHRHEWFKHGTCHGGVDAQKYFEYSLRLLDMLNNSSVRQLFESRIGEELQTTEIRAELVNAFGRHAGSKITIICGKDGSRNLITELQIILTGDFGTDSLEELLDDSKEQRPKGCRGGQVDPVGWQ